MPKPIKGPRLGGNATHQGLILRNLATQLFEHGRIKTTETKARLLQPFAEKLITKAKRGDLASRRLVLQDITDKAIVAKLFEQIAPELAGREGGYTRITKIGPRKGDNAPMALIEVITEPVAPKAKAQSETAAADAAATKEAIEADEAETAEDAEGADTDSAEETETAEAESAESDAAEPDTNEADESQ